MIQRLLCLTILLCLTACSSEAQEGAASGDGAERSARPAAGESGTLLLAGSAVESPGEYEVEIGCQYSRSPGVLQVTAHGTDARPGTLSLTIGPSGIGFEDGTYGGRFTLDEPRDDGRVLTHHGEIQATIDVLEARRGGLPVAEIRARGSAEGMEFEFTGECPTVGAG